MSLHSAIILPNIYYIAPLRYRALGYKRNLYPIYQYLYTIFQAERDYERTKEHCVSN